MFRLPGSTALARALPILAVASLAACASDYTRPDGQPVDEGRLDRDVAACEAQSTSVDPLAGTAIGFLGGAFWGALNGASIGALAGNAGEGAIIGVAAGAVIGTIVGTATGNQDVAEAQDACMKERGYQVSSL